MKASVIIRTYNEERHIGAVLEALAAQETDFESETIVIDSGSADRTLDIVERFDCRVLHIEKHRFSFGRSLNMGCEAASGSHLAFISGHCIPASTQWLKRLVTPLGADSIAYVYGAQHGHPTSNFSEARLLAKRYPKEERIPQDGFFCNNANAALLKSVWCEYPFDEALTGLEDMHLAKTLTQSGYRIGYVAAAPVCHIHHESWSQIRRRYEREAIALQYIMPEVQITFLDFLRYFSSAVFLDSVEAAHEKVLARTLKDIVLYRLMQFWGSYRGNHFHRKLSRERKEKYFYPQ
jgi:glycosyltransferase involved in cell wall biosynthesis